MPFLAGLILNGLLSIAGTLAGRALLALGFGIVSYSGVSVSLTWLKTQAIASASALPPQAYQLLSYMQVGNFINLIFSALLARMILNGLQGDTVKKWVSK